jgi:hypothetical protein
MKNKFAFQNFNTLDRRAVSYTVSTVIIATVFLIAMVGIFTGRFKPFASEIAPSPSVIGDAAQGVSIPPAQLQFSYSDGVTGIAQSNALSLNLSNLPQAILSLQGVKKTADTEKNLAVGGKISVRDKDGKVIASSLDWGGDRTFIDETKIQVSLSNPALLDALDSQNASNDVTYTLQPKYYLAVSAKAKAGDTSVTFPVAPAGDLNEDNKIDGADFARWGVHFDEGVTAETSLYDFNKDGKIDGADFSVAYTDNFGKAGDSL